MHTKVPLDFLQKLSRTKKGVVRMTETRRIVEMPSADYSGDVTADFALPGCDWELRPIQSEALSAIRHCGGGLFSIGVGWGKTLIGFLAATAAGCKASIVLCPASTARQMEDMYADIAKRFDTRPAVIIPYSRLSRPEGTAMLEEALADLRAKGTIKEDSEVLVVADEVHKLKRKESARTKRFLRFMEAHPHIGLVAMSGTLTSKSIKDVAHIADAVFGEESPIPRNQHHLNAWSECIDVAGQPGRSDWETVRPLWDRYNSESYINVHGAARREGIRTAFQKRFSSSPGVVCSEAGALGCSLEMFAERVDVPPEISAHMRRVIDEGLTPDNAEVADDIAAWRVLQQLSSGYYYQWQWPDGEVNYEWLDARNEWNRHVRRELAFSADEGYDSPLLVANRIRSEVEAGMGRAIHSAWYSWFGTGLNKVPAPPTVPIWVDTFLIDHAVQWLKDSYTPAILWYSSRAVEEAFKQRGIVVYGAGANPPSEGHKCAMSIQAHGVGKNLQHGWSRQLIVNPPSGGKVWEQLLGRTHRPGQTEDTVEVYVYQHTQFLRRALRSAEKDAEYIQDSTGSRQKLCYCVKAGSAW